MNEEMKEQIRNLDPLYDWYICVDCRGLGIATKKGFNSTVLGARKSKCLNCLNSKNSKNKKAAAKLRNKKIEKTLKACEICKEGFMTISGKTCSQKCRNKLREKTTFYKDLGKANVEVDASKVHLFGQGNYAVSLSDKKVQKGLK